MKTLSFNKIFVVLLFLSLSAISLQAQKGDPNANRNDSHFFTISLSGGISGFNLMPSPDSMKVTTLPLAGGSLGLGYEWQSANGVWVGLGLEGQILTGRLQNTQDIYHIDEVVDSENDTSDITYNIVVWKERQRVLYVNLPIMVGYKFESGFYFGAGVKVGLGLYADIQSDFQFNDCVVFYKKYPPMQIKESVTADNVLAKDNGFVGRLKLSPAFEIGWQSPGVKKSTHGHGGDVKLKLALCGEFGALTAYSNSKEGNLLSYNNLNGFNDLMAVMDMLDGINSYYSTMPIGMNKGDFATMKDMGQFQNYSKPSNLYSWYVGVKVGILFEMPKKRGCNCLRNNVIKPWKKDFENKGVE